MANSDRKRRIHDFLGSVHIFQSVVDQLLDEESRAAIGPAPTTGQLKLLHLVERTERSTVSDVADFLGISRAAASKAVDRLVRRDLLARTESPDDRRVTLLSLTAAGRELLAVCTRAREDALGMIFEGCSVEDLSRVTRVLDRLSVAFAKHDPGSRDLCYRCGVFFRDHCLLREHGSGGCYQHLRLASGRGRRRALAWGRTSRR
jgi:DNA-binding MarR family transcriptional regulator